MTGSVAFHDDDAAIMDSLRDVSVPALLASLVHITGDPSWVRGAIHPRILTSMDIQGNLDLEVQEEVRRRAVPVIAEYRDRGCEEVSLPLAVILELMSFLAGHEPSQDLTAMVLEDLQLDGIDSGAIRWGDEVTADDKAASNVLVIGCGMSGILAGIRLSQAGLPFTIVDKNDGPGGTWWENGYPGARVDVASRQYCYSFEPSDWTEYYCQQPELRDYFARIHDTYDLACRCRFGISVESLRWGDDDRWHARIRTRDGRSEELVARFVISAVGSLNLPHVLDLPGMADFAGPSFHSVSWPADLDLEGARVALIGAGASGFQIAPAIAGRVRSLTIYQRTPQWMSPNPLYRAPVAPGDRWAIRHLPGYARWCRFIMTYPGVAAGTAPFRVDPAFDDASGSAISDANLARREQLTAWITSQLPHRPDLVDLSVPAYPVFGKRPLQDDGSWLRCLREPHVELVRTGIDRIDARGVVTSDRRHRVADVICYATGFRHNDFLASLDVRGSGGRNLREQWGTEPTAYFGITVPGFPNLFCMYGPGTNLAHSASLFFHSEFQVHYVMEAIRLVLSSGKRTIEVHPEVHDDYVSRHQREMTQLVWAHPSIRHSHYKNPDGKVFTLSPWTLPQYWAMTRRVEPGEYQIR